MAAGNDQIAQIISKLDMQNFNPGAIHMVHVTYIKDPKNFYVRLVTLDEDMPFVEGRGDPITEENITIGKRVIFKTRKHGKFVRGEIQFILFRENSVYCTIFAIDYGFKDKNVPSKYIFLPDLEMDCPPLALNCELHFCEPRGDTFEIDTINAMKFFVGKNPCRMTVVFPTTTKFIIELQTLECPDDVSTMLGLLHFTTFTHTNNAVSRFSQGLRRHFLRVKYTYKQVQVGERLRVRVQSGNSIDGFYVAELNDHKMYMQEGDPFTAYCKHMPAQDIQAAIEFDLCCGVKVSQSSNYERAIVKSIITPDAKALVKLIDTGKEVEVNFDNIKCMNAQTYATLPAVAIYCSSTEDQTWDNGLSKFLYEGYTFMIEITELGNGIDIPHKVNLFRMEGC